MEANKHGYAEMDLAKVFKEVFYTSWRSSFKKWCVLKQPMKRISQEAKLMKSLIH